VFGLDRAPGSQLARLANIAQCLDGFFHLVALPPQFLEPHIDRRLHAWHPAIRPPSGPEFCLVDHVVLTPTEPHLTFQSKA
jgi:hypothetical protein